MKVLVVKQTISSFGFAKPDVHELEAVEFSQGKVAVIGKDEQVTVYLTRELALKELEKQGKTEIIEEQQ